jgi:hypothetical protein
MYVAHSNNFSHSFLFFQNIKITLINLNTHYSYFAACKNISHKERNLCCHGMVVRL